VCLAIPGRIIEIAAAQDDDSLLDCTGKVEFGGIIKEVSLALVPAAKVGDYVLIHAGVAINTVDEKEATETIDYIRQIEAMADTPDDRSDNDDNSAS
jgi:hydrogenase expression/formation protein HypC